MDVAPPATPRFPLWALWGGLLLALAYAPTLATRFDFIDDGNLVYPAEPMPLGQRVGVVWNKVYANFHDLGPFRPMVWVHWELTAELTQGSELGWRASRFAWCAVSAIAFLWLLSELGIPPLAAFAAAAVAMWNPFRNEIWTSLTLSEGVAMPYAVLALVFARRAARSPHPAIWDIGSALCVLAALLCKNTFAALIPAQMFLRLASDEMTLSEAWQKNGRRALLLGITLLLPVAHFVYFKLTWHPGQYRPGTPTIFDVFNYLAGLRGAMSLDFLGLGLGLGLLAWLLAPKQEGGPFRYRAALGAGTLLVLAGIAVYLPIRAVTGRYTIPSVWGLDLFLAVGLASLSALPRTRLWWASQAALACGLCVLLVACVGKQQKFAARAQMLWEALEWVEQNAPHGSEVAWVSGTGPDDLNVEEGAHFHWHLIARGRSDLNITFCSQEGRSVNDPSLIDASPYPAYRIWGGRVCPPCAGGFQEKARLVVRYWAGQRTQVCSVGG
jgi:hypothetical protein